MSITIKSNEALEVVSIPRDKSYGINDAEKREAGKREYISKESLDKALEKINTFLNDNNTYAEYEMHDKLNHIMIRIINKDTHEVLLEVPPKKILDLVSRMCELVGILVDEKV